MSATAHLPREDLPSTFQGRALIAGRDVSLLQAADEAAGLLGDARLPLLILGCDTAAVIAALELGEQIESVADVAESEALAREIGELHAPGGYTVSRREAYARADVVLVTGPAAADALGLLAEPRIPLRVGQRRDILDLGDFAGPSCAAGDAVARLSILAALLRPDPVPIHSSPAFADARAFAERLRKARYGVVVWSPADLDQPGIALVANLVNLLNGQTRFSAMSVRTGGNAWGAAHLMLARWGVPPRARFAGGCAEHDPWRYGAARLLQAGEADAVLAIGTLADLPALRASRTISIAAGLGSGAHVEFQAGVPGLDHDGEWFDAGADAMTVRPATAPSSRPRAAELIREIAARLRGGAK